TLVVNKLRGTLKVAAVRAAGFGDRRNAILDDISTLTGGRVISDDLGIALGTVTLDDLGRAKSVTISRDLTTIVEGGGNPSEIESRIRSLRAQSQDAVSDY